VNEERVTRQIRIAFEDGSASAIVDLLEDDAPATCEALWQLLPLRVSAIHDIWSGHLVLAHLADGAVLPPENVLTYIPIPGDVFYYHRPSHYVRGAPFGWAESSELGIVYDRDTRPQGPRGPEAVNLFAHISSGLEDLARTCEQMIWRGQQNLLIERVG
jgi:Protein of unknown function (DUF3830)